MADRVSCACERSVARCLLMLGCGCLRVLLLVALRLRLYVGLDGAGLLCGRDGMLCLLLYVWLW